MNIPTNRFHVITLTLTSLLGFGSAVGAASCAQAGEALAVTVSYQDLNLSSPADVQTLYRRLKRAASTVCTPAQTWELSRRLAYSRCYNAALDSAVMAVRSPELLALDRAARNGRVS
jgi:UrcA family protein